MNNEESGEKGAEEEVPVSTSEPNITPEPNPFWKQNAEKLIGESISSVEDSAKQFIAITGLLQGIYFHAITFSDVREEPAYSVLIYVAPLLLWLLSLIFAMLVLFRKKYGININSSRDSKENFEKIAAGKLRLIRISGFFLILSFVALVIAVLHYMGLITYQTFLDIEALL